MANIAVKNDRLPILDGIRGYAALWVLLGHCSNLSGLNLPLLNRPQMAVDVFMIMSGFLMTQHYFLRQDREPWESPRTWMKFWVRRFFRIAPLYYAVLIPAVLWHSFLLTHLVQSTEKPMSAGNLLSHPEA